MHIDMFVEFIASNQIIVFQGAVTKLQINNQAHLLLENCQNFEDQEIFTFSGSIFLKCLKNSYFVFSPTKDCLQAPKSIDRQCLIGIIGH